VQAATALHVDRIVTITSKHALITRAGFGRHMWVSTLDSLFQIARSNAVGTRSRPDVSRDGLRTEHRARNDQQTEVITSLLLKVK
jgi:hypothetical protein